MIRYLSMCLFVLLLATDGYGQKTRLLLMGPTNVVLDVRNSGIEEETAADDDDSTRLIWKGIKHKSKVTVSTFSPGQRFTLKIEATGARNGVASGQINLHDGMMPTDLIVNISSKKPGASRIRYLAQASIEEGNTDGDYADIHHISFTLTDQ